MVVHKLAEELREASEEAREELLVVDGHQGCLADEEGSLGYPWVPRLLCGGLNEVLNAGKELPVEGGHAGGVHLECLVDDEERLKDEEEVALGLPCYCGRDQRAVEVVEQLLHIDRSHRAKILEATHEVAQIHHYRLLPLA